MFTVINKQVLKRILNPNFDNIKWALVNIQHTF